MQDREFDRFAGATRPGAKVRFHIQAPDSLANPTQFFAALGGLFMAGAAVTLWVRGRRRQKLARGIEREELVAAVAALDDRLALGEITPEDHRAERTGRLARPARVVRVAPDAGGAGNHPAVRQEVGARGREPQRGAGGAARPAGGERLGEDDPAQDPRAAPAAGGRGGFPGREALAQVRRDRVGFLPTPPTCIRPHPPRKPEFFRKLFGMAPGPARERVGALAGGLGLADRLDDRSGP